MNKIIKIRDTYKFILFFVIFVTLVFIILVFKDWFSKHMFGIDKDFNFKGSGSINIVDKNMFYAYTTEKQKLNTNFAVKFRNILTSSASKNKHFLVDLTFIVNNEKEANLFEKYKENITVIIKEILNKYTFTYINSDSGKTFLKNQITKRVEEKIGNGIIREVYIETILYN
jgi:flagellar basal body-associated protein FliL